MPNVCFWCDLFKCQSSSRKNFLFKFVVVFWHWQDLKVTVCSPRNPPAMSRSPQKQNGKMAKDAWWVRKMYWSRERAHDKTGEWVVFMVCTAGAFIGRVDNVKKCMDNKGWENDKSLIRRWKIDKVTKIDKATKGE